MVADEDGDVAFHRRVEELDAIDESVGAALDVGVELVDVLRCDDGVVVSLAKRGVAVLERCDELTVGDVEGTTEESSEGRVGHAFETGASLEGGRADCRMNVSWEDDDAAAAILEPRGEEIQVELRDFVLLLVVGRCFVGDVAHVEEVGDAKAALLAWEGEAVAEVDIVLQHVFSKVGEEVVAHLHDFGEFLVESSWWGRWPTRRSRRLEVVYVRTPCKSVQMRTYARTARGASAKLLASSLG